MERTIYHYVDGVAIPIPSCTGFGPTPFLRKMVRLLEDNKVTMGQLPSPEGEGLLGQA